MPMIPEDEIARLKRGTDLAAVIRSRGVELKPSGHDLVGLCPFHEDHDPSLRVTPGKGLWRCMSCGATGNVIQFVQKFDGVSFRHAYELLKTGRLSALSAPSPGAPFKKSTVPRLPAPLTSEADDQAALRQVVGYYHERLKENPPALAYLKKRGIGAEAAAAFRIGFVDRTLGLRLPHSNRREGAAIRERLTRLGILRATGHEHLRGRVVFPIVAESGAIGTVYGRAIDEHGRHDRHLFLPGPQRGVWNPAALSSQPNGEIIVTEGIIDALTFWGAGFRHVTTGYSAKALPEELLDALLTAKVARVLIAFDRDEAGDQGAAEVAAQLAAHGVECLRVMFPPGMDANEYALKVTPPEKSLGVLLRAALPVGDGRRVAAPSPSRADASAPSSLAAVAAKEKVAADLSAEAVAEAEALAKAAKEEESLAPVAAVSAVAILKHEPDEVVLGLGDRTWTVRGLQKNPGFESLKVTLRVSVREACHAEARPSVGGWHLDTLDLCSARQRECYVSAAAAETLLKPELLKRDLGKVLLALEQLQEARLKAEVTPKHSAPAVAESEREAALELLRSPDLLNRILADFAACGVVGEETNKLVGYLAAVSRKLDQPLAVILQSTSAAGKTALMEAVLAFVPPEERVKYSALTGQALYYLSDADLKHKILAIVEEEGAERASYALKLLQSEGELTIASTGKDPHTGRMVTQEYRVEGPVMIFLTTTAVDIDEELLNRCLVLTVDEGREQTAAIHRLQRERETLAGLLRRQERERLLAVHRNAQRLLRPLAVVNPFAEKLTFLDDRTRTRRDHTKYLALIRCIALLHQHQRAVKSVEHQGRRIDYLEATLQDIAAANALAHEVLGRSLDEMPPQTRRLLGLVHRMVAERCTAKQMERADCLFSRRQVRDTTGWSDSQLKTHLARLEDMEYLVAHRGGRGQSFVYELAYDGGGEDGRRFLPGLIDAEKLGAGQAYDSGKSGLGAKKSGPEAQLSGSSLAQVGPGLGDKNGGSPSETPAPAPKVRRNAHQAGALAVAS